MKISKRYQKLMEEEFCFFWIAWFLLAFSPLIAAFFFEAIATQKVEQLTVTLLLVASIVLLLALYFFISISLWAAFKGNFSGDKRAFLVVSSFFMIWLGFGNFYYFSCDISDLLAKLGGSPTGAGLVLEGIGEFWEFCGLEQGSDSGFTAINRLDNYIDCLYFSAVSILTIGYGDIVPISKMSKILVMIEAFLGQLINVVAVGLWLSTISENDSDDPK